MKACLALALLLAALVALEAPAADARRCVTNRRACRRFGGLVRGGCRVRVCRTVRTRGGRPSRRAINRCRRRCRGRGQRRRRCRNNCRRSRGGRTRRTCRIRRVYRCRFNVRGVPAFDDVDDVVVPDRGLPVAPVTPVVPVNPIAPTFCPETCFLTNNPAALQCPIGCAPAPCNFQRTQWKCSSGSVPQLPSPADCFGGCAAITAFPRVCNAQFCELSACGNPNSFPATFSCVAKLNVPPTTPPPSTTPSTGVTTPTTPPVTCPSLCTPGASQRNVFLAVSPPQVCNPTGCKTVLCQVLNTTLGGYGCVSQTSTGAAVTLTPADIAFPAFGTATPSPSPTPMTAVDPTTGTVTTTPTASPTPSPSAGASTTPTASPTPSPSAGASTTPTATATPTPTPSVSPTLPTGVVTAAEWDKCTITRGGTRNTVNPVSAPNGQPIQVDVTIINEGVINLACKKDEVTITCDPVSGNINVKLNNPLQAAQLDIDEMYPPNSVLVYDVRAFDNKPCLLRQFNPTAGESALQRAERIARKKIAECSDVHFKIAGRSGSAGDATLTGTVEPATCMFTSAVISNAAANRMLVREGMNDTMFGDLSSSARVPTDSNEDEFSGTVEQGGTDVRFSNGELTSELNSLDTVSITVTSNGNQVSSVYGIRRNMGVRFTTGIFDAGDTPASKFEEPFILSTLRSSVGYPNVNVTPVVTPPNCCDIPDLKFDELFMVMPYLQVNANGGGEITSSNNILDVQFPEQAITLTVSGGKNSQSASFAPANFAQVTMTDAQTAASTPIPISGSETDYSFDFSTGLIPMVSFVLPTVHSTMQNSIGWNWVSQSGDALDDPPGSSGGDTLLIDPTGGTCADGNNAADQHQLGITVSREITNGIISNVPIGNPTGTTSTIPGLNVARNRVLEACYFCDANTCVNNNS